MAKAMNITQTTEAPVVVLALTPDEARDLRTVLANVGWEATHPIFAALGDAGVAWCEHQEFRTTKTMGCLIAVTD